MSSSLCSVASVIAGIRLQSLSTLGDIWNTGQSNSMPMECFAGICHLHCTIVCLVNENNRKIQNTLSYSKSRVYDFLTGISFFFEAFYLRVHLGTFLLQNLLPKIGLFWPCHMIQNVHQTFLSNQGNLHQSYADRLVGRFIEKSCKRLNWALFQELK